MMKKIKYKDSLKPFVWFPYGTDMQRTVTLYVDMRPTGGTTIVQAAEKDTDVMVLKDFVNVLVDEKDLNRALGPCPYTLLLRFLQLCVRELKYIDKYQDRQVLSAEEKRDTVKAVNAVIHALSKLCTMETNSMNVSLSLNGMSYALIGRVTHHQSIHVSDLISVVKDFDKLVSGLPISTVKRMCRKDPDLEPLLDAVYANKWSVYVSESPWLVCSPCMADDKAVIRKIASYMGIAAPPATASASSSTSETMVQQELDMTPGLQMEAAPTEAAHVPTNTTPVPTVDSPVPTVIMSQGEVLTGCPVLPEPSLNEQLTGEKDTVFPIQLTTEMEYICVFDADSSRLRPYATVIERCLKSVFKERVCVEIRDNALVIVIEPKNPVYDVYPLPTESDHDKADGTMHKLYEVNDIVNRAYVGVLRLLELEDSIKGQFRS